MIELEWKTTQPSLRWMKMREDHKNPHWLEGCESHGVVLNGTNWPSGMRKMVFPSEGLVKGIRKF